MPQFHFHQGIHCRILRLHHRRGRHVPGDPLGVAHHRQKVSSRKPFLAIVTDTDLLGQEEGISDGAAELVAVLGLRAPVDPAVTTNIMCGSVDLPGRLVIQKTIRLLAENILTDHPAAVVGVSREIGILAGEKILMLNDVAEFKPLKFLGERLGRIARQLAVQPLHQDLPFSFAGLLGLLRRHVFKMNRLLGQRIQLLQINRVNCFQFIEPNIPLLFLRPVTGNTAGLHHLQGPVVQLARVQINLLLSIRCEQTQHSKARCLKSPARIIRYRMTALTHRPYWWLQSWSPGMARCLRPAGTG